MATMFVWIYNKIKKRRFIALFVLLALLLLALLQMRNFDFQDDFNQVFPQSKKISTYNEILSNSRLLDRIVLHVFLKDSLSEPNPEHLSNIAWQLRDSLSAKLYPKYISSIQPESGDQLFHQAFGFFYKHLPYYLDDSDYQWLEETATDSAWLVEQMGRNYRKLIAPTGMVMRDFILQDPLQIVLSKTALLQDMQMEDNLSLYDGFLITEDQRSLMFFLQPRDAANTSDNEVFVSGMEKYIALLAEQYPDVHIDMYGSVPVAIANTRQIKKDVQLTVSLAFVLLLVLMTYFFRSKRSVILIFLPVVFGALLALAFFALFKPEISAISLAIAAVILGVAIDFSLHFLTHRKHSGSSEQTLRDISEPVVMSSLTTATAFLCLLFISSPALRDMGVFAAISVFASALGALLILPHLVKGRVSTQAEAPVNYSFIERLAAQQWHKKKYLLILIVLFSVVLLYSARFTGFDEDIEKTAYMTPELVAADERLKSLTSITEQTVYVMTSGESLDACLHKNEELVAALDELYQHEKVQSYHTIQRIIPTLQEQEEKIVAWNRFWEERKEPFKRQVSGAGQAYGFNEQAFAALFNMIDKTYVPISPDSLQSEMSAFVDDFVIRVDEDHVYLANLVKVATEESRDAVYQTMSSYPQTYVFDRKNIAERLFELLRNDFSTLITYSLIIVFAILYLFFGRLELALLTFFPMLLSWLWVIGIMGLLQVDFNIFNVVITSFIFGLGIDYAIFMTKGYLQQIKSGVDTLISYRSSILISSMTTLIALGVLMLAKHPALQSIALLSMIGIASVVLVTFTLQPLLLSAMFYEKGVKRPMPVTLSQFVYSSYAFLFFALISLTITALVPLFYIAPFDRYKKQRWFRYLIYLSCRGVILTSWVVKKEFPGINKSVFKHASIIVSNHQSVTDLLFFMGTSPNIIILTKDWVWNNFFFGRIVRFAGYINISEGNEKVLPKIQDALQRGESILVFPEGSRTRNGRIRRFHKGAFYLAERLRADVTAILLDGYFEALPPGHFLVNNAVMTMKYLKRMRPDDMQQGYSQTSKDLCRYFREEREQLRRSKQRFVNYKDQLVKKYIYKGPAVEYYVKVKFWGEHYYQLIEPLIPAKARVTDMGCGYGMLANMLTLTSDEREVKGVDFDRRKIEIAKSTVGANQHLTFMVADLSDYTPESSDVFILSDVLHYLPKSLQIELLERCYSHLLPGGQIIIRDGNADLTKKHRGTRFTEFISTNIGFNKSRYPLSFLSYALIEDFALSWDLQVKTFDSTRLTSNQLYVLTKG